MQYDYAKLRGRIREIYKNEKAFADALHISRATISSKLNNKFEFTQDEMESALALLRIEPAEINQYFFNRGGAE